MKGYWKLFFTPLVLASFELASLFPESVEHWYGEGLYPHVVAGFDALDFAGFSLAELFLVIGVAALPLVLKSALRGPTWRERAVRFATFVWVGAGVILFTFLALWGYNYARPPLSTKLGLEERAYEPRAVLEAGRRAARYTASLYRELRPTHSPSRLPTSFEELDADVDEGFRALALPGDTIRTTTSVAKPLLSSELFSHLGISGLFIPFTGEPSINHLQPDVALPIVVAHEKAHQRGIGDEGEANFAAFLVCSRRGAPLYLRYAAYLFATRYLLSEASYHLPEEELLEAWNLLGAGPTEDLIAIRNFWRRYQGPASEVAARVNDRYLRSVGVEEGVRSYSTVVSQLMALDARSELIEEP